MHRPVCCQGPAEAAKGRLETAECPRARWGLGGWWCRGLQFLPQGLCSPLPFLCSAILH